MPNQALLIVGHGSRVAEAVGEFNQFANALSAALGRPALRCFLELADPDLAEGLSQAAEAAETGGEVVVLPLFLGAAAHQKNDVPSAIRWAQEQFPRVTFRYGGPLGVHARLVELLGLRVQHCLESAVRVLPPDQTAILVVGRGSSDPDANGEIAKLARLLFEQRPFLAVEYAFQAVARPRVDDGIWRCRALGAEQVIVAPFTLFTGVVVDDIRQTADHAADGLSLRILHAAHLGVHPLLVEVAVQRIQEATEGGVAMNCDLCKYRSPMAGYEHQVGLPQATHHLHGGSAHDHEHDHGHDHGEKR